MENLAVILVPLGLGLLLKRFKAFPDSTPQALNAYVVHVALPALVLLQVPRMELTTALWVPAVMPWLMLGFSVGAVLLVARIFAWDRALTGGMLMVVPLGNTSFFGIPMIQTFFGDDHVGYALIYDQFGSFLALSFYGAAILAFYGGQEKLSARRVLLRIITFPPFIALMAAFAFKGLGGAYPAIAETLLARLADTLVPVVMVAVGFMFRIRLPGNRLGPLAWGLGLKLVATPLAALAFCRLIGADDAAATVSVFEAGMPPMITAGALAAAAGLAPEVMAAMIGLGILLSLVTLPILYAIL